MMLSNIHQQGFTCPEKFIPKVIGHVEGQNVPFLLLLLVQFY